MIKIRQLLRCKFKINFGRFNFRAFSFGKNLIGNLRFQTNYSIWCHPEFDYIFKMIKFLSLILIFLLGLTGINLLFVFIQKFRNSVYFFRSTEKLDGLLWILNVSWKFEV